MAERNEEEPLALRLFRRTGKISVEIEGGNTLKGRGIVSALRQETGEPGGKRHAVGNLSRPLYRFTGFLPEAGKATGGTLTQGERRYTVLDVRPVFLGEREVCVRALLEMRKEETEDEIV